MQRHCTPVRTPRGPSSKGTRRNGLRWFFRCALALASLFIVHGSCWADSGSCFGGADSVVFGNQSVTSLQNATSVGDVIAGCYPGQGPSATWDFCASVGVGTNSVSETDRRMTSGSTFISYQLYTDPSYTTIFQYPGTNMVAVNYSSTSNTFDIQYVYAKILTSGASIPPGTYTDSYSTGAQTAVTNDSMPTGIPALECTGSSGAHPWNTTAFAVSVTLLPSCSVSASPLDFGVAGLLSANIDAATNLSVSCSYTTPYSIALSAGNGLGATTSTRAMTNGAVEVFYSLYTDSARTQNWGANVGVDTLAGVGTGSIQSIPVYGRVPPQATPAIGNYADTVVVTVNY